MAHELAQHVIDQTESRTDAYHQAQPVREALRDDTALDFWFQAFREGRYTLARRQWFDIVEPATRIRD